MQSLDALDNLGSIETSSVPSKPSPSRKLRSEIASGVKVESEVERVLVVKGVVELDDEWVDVSARAGLEDRLLGLGVGELAMGEDLREWKGQLRRRRIDTEGKERTCCL